MGHFLVPRFLVHGRLYGHLCVADNGRCVCDPLGCKKLLRSLVASFGLLDKLAKLRERHGAHGFLDKPDRAGIRLTRDLIHLLGELGQFPIELPGNVGNHCVDIGTQLTMDNILRLGLDLFLGQLRLIAGNPILELR